MWDVHQRARRGIRLLVGRQAVLQLLAIGGGIVVARGLGPERLGVFGIALFVVGMLALVADLGMRTVLIRRAAPVTELELGTCFTVQQGLVTALVALLVMAAPAVATLYGQAPGELAWLLRLLALDLYLRSWRGMSEVRLERELRYRELAVADVVGSVGYQAVAIGLVLAGWGVESLAWAVLTGNVLRTALLYHASPWPVRLVLYPPAVRELVGVGVPLQASNIVSLTPGWVTPTLVAGLVGPEAVGLVTWAAAIGRKPLEALENIVRVSLSHFARLQDDVEEVERILARYVIVSLLVCGLWLAVLAVAGRDLVTLVYTERWLPAMPALLLYAVAGMLASVRRLAVAALIGIGRVRFTAQVSAAGALVAVGASTILVLRVGFVGVPLGQLAGIALAVPWLLSGLRPGAQARILRGGLAVLAPMAAAIAAGSLTTLVPLAPAARGLVTAGVISAVYAAVAWRVGPEWLRSGVRAEVALSVRQLRESATP
ncbi:MAG TPA: oligosaccharide flippase family protein [Candidatus Binatus sp.]|nr:oligosaccharide flippase family protein [Candidatus Binatus sp.]